MQIIKKGSLHEEFMAKLHYIDVERKLDTSYIIFFLQNRNSQV
jgi:hypothetical protein